LEGVTGEKSEWKTAALFKDWTKAGRDTGIS
jgi:hypothetical protein